MTGAGGFLGRHLVRRLRDGDARVLALLGKNVGRLSSGLGPEEWLADLREPEQAASVFRRFGPFDVVFHLAGHNGGIAFNGRFPADVFRDNTLMAVNVVEACGRNKVRRVVSVVASCAYEAPAGVCYEERFLQGNPPPSTDCHGYAKRALYLASRFYRRQYGLDAVCVCPTTLYGPGDCYDAERTKVVGGMVRRFVEARRAGLEEVSVWGTGRPLRELLYVEDAARLVAESAAADFGGSDLVNLCGPGEVRVAELAVMAADAAGYQGRIAFDASRPDGKYRKALDARRMGQLFPDTSWMLPLPEGLRRTVADYEERFPCQKKTT